MIGIQLKLSLFKTTVRSTIQSKDNTMIEMGQENITLMGFLVINLYHL